MILLKHHLNMLKVAGLASTMHTSDISIDVHSRLNHVTMVTTTFIFLFTSKLGLYTYEWTL